MQTCICKLLAPFCFTKRRLLGGELRKYGRWVTWHEDSMTYASCSLPALAYLVDHFLVGVVLCSMFGTVDLGQVDVLVILCVVMCNGFGLFLLKFGIVFVEDRLGDANPFEFVLRRLALTL